MVLPSHPQEMFEDGVFPFRGEGVGDLENKFSNQEETEPLPW